MKLPYMHTLTKRKSMHAAEITDTTEFMDIMELIAAVAAPEVGQWR